MTSVGLRHHVAHAASATFASGMDPCSVLVLDGRGESASQLAGRFAGGELEPLAQQALPHSLGLLYEELTEHLGFRRSSDEYKVMAMASYGEPAFLDELRNLVYADGVGGFRVEPFEFSLFAPALRPGEPFSVAHAALACSVQRRLEEVLLELARWLHRHTGDADLVLAGGVALELRRQLAAVAREPVRAHLGPAGVRRLRHGAGRGAARGAPTG